MRDRAERTPAPLLRVQAGRIERRDDLVATEEPLEIRLRWREEIRTVAVTMRTPGHDAELAAGFLFGEGVIDGPDALGGFEAPEPNVVEVALATESLPELKTLERHFFASSACGVCGKAGLEALRLRLPQPIPPGPRIAAELLVGLPEKLRAAQDVFESTGGLHAAALFDTAGSLLALREDVGRHNALDKLVGWALREGRLPLHDHVVMVSGRTSYEILQKGLTAGVPILCAVSAPSSLAVELAQEFGVTLVGFLRGDRFNVYSGASRLEGAPASASRRLPIV